MKKFFKTIMILVLMLTLVMSATLTAFADPDDENTQGETGGDGDGDGDDDGDDDDDITDTPTPDDTTPTEEITDSPTPEEDTPTPEDTDTPTPTNTNTPTATNTPVPVRTTTPEPDNPTPRITSQIVTATPTPTNTSTPTPTGTASVTPSLTPSGTVFPFPQNVEYPAPNEKSEKTAEVKSHAIIKVDGIIEDLWSEIEAIPVQNVSWGENGATGSFKAYWDKSELYILVEVSDTTPDTKATKFSRKDCVEVFLNENGNKPAEYGPGDCHYKISRAGEIELGNGGSEDLISYAVSDAEDSYKVEIGIPFTVLKPRFGSMIGFDVRINDSQNDQYRDYMTQWSDTSMYTYSDLSKIGTLNLK